MKIEEFIESIEGLSLNTRKSYEQTLWQLESAIQGEEPTVPEIYDFLKHYGPSSLHRHRAAIKAYLEFQDRPWPFTRRQFMQKRQRIPRYVSTEVVEKIMECAENEDEKMFVRTLFLLGCRIRELMSIKGENIVAGGVRIVIKGGDEYRKITTKDFNRELREYAGGRDGPLFPHSYSYYNKLLKKLGAKAGYPQITLHMLRHARAVDLQDKGFDLVDIQQFLHHASINTTAIYLQVGVSKLASRLEEVEKG